METAVEKSHCLLTVIQPVSDEAGILKTRPSVSSGEGNDNPLQYFRLESPMDRGAWQATVYRVSKSQTRPK